MHYTHLLLQTLRFNDTFVKIVFDKILKRRYNSFNNWSYSSEMPKLKRDIVKYVRDKAKSRYEKGTECRICRAKAPLDFHHFYSLTPLLNQWITKNKHNPEYIQALRDDFIEEHQAELYEHTTTLCHMHHLKLHSVYGKDPALTTATKQKRWVEIQREKHGMV